MNPTQPIAATLDAVQTAVVMQCSVRHIRRLIGDGKISVIRLGRLVRIPKREIERILAGEAK